MRISGRGGSTRSTVANTGSGASTMPAPPPKGESSTERCGSTAAERRSWTRRSSNPWRRALPIRLWPSHASTMSGKTVMTSMRTASPSVEQPGGKVGHDHAGPVLDDEAQRHQAAAVEDEQVAGRVGLDGHHRAVVGTVRLDETAPDQLMDPELPGVLHGLGAEDEVAQRLGPLPSFDSGEGHDPPVLVGRGGENLELDVPGVEAAARVEPFGPVGGQLDHHLSLRPWGLTIRPTSSRLTGSVDDVDLDVDPVAGAGGPDHRPQGLSDPAPTSDDLSHVVGGDV